MHASGSFVVHSTQVPSVHTGVEGLAPRDKDRLNFLARQITDMMAPTNFLATNPEAQRLLKEVFWQGGADWDELLEQRAELSARLVLSDFTKEALAKYS